MAGINESVSPVVLSSIPISPRADPDPWRKGLSLPSGLVDSSSIETTFLLPPPGCATAPPIDWLQAPEMAPTFPCRKGFPWPIGLLVLVTVGSPKI